MTIQNTVFLCEQVLVWFYFIKAFELHLCCNMLYVLKKIIIQLKLKSLKPIKIGFHWHHLGTKP